MKSKARIAFDRWFGASPAATNPMSLTSTTPQTTALAQRLDMEVRKSNRNRYEEARAEELSGNPMP